MMRVQVLLPYTILAASVFATGFGALAPVPTHPMAAVFPPWWSAARSFNAAAVAGAPIVRAGAFGNILVLAAGSPDLPGRLRDAGAWLLLDAVALGGCAAKL